MVFEKEINLIPVNKSIDFRKLLPFIAIPAGLFLLAGILLTIGIMQQMKISRLNAELTGVKEEITSLGYLNENVKRIEEKKAELQSRKDTIETIELEKVKVLEFLNKLKLYVPVSVRITSLSISNGQDVVINFETSNTYDIARLMVRLTEMDAFEKVDAVTLPIDDKTNIIAFNLKLKKDDGKVPVK